MDLKELLKFVPKNHLSMAVGKLVNLPLPEQLSKLSVKVFVKQYKINMAEAEHPIEHYKTIGQLFTRKLRADARPIGGEVVHPADSRIVEMGNILKGQLIQAKGKIYSLESFLASENDALTFEGGFFATYYLCPTDYHRVHFPVTGFVESVRHIPGTLWPVNSWGLKNIDGLFSANERVISFVQSPHGRVAVAMVGATNVGKISLSFDGSIVSNTNFNQKEINSKHYADPIPIKAGDEMGVFHMGSTVIVLYPKESGIKFGPSLYGAHVKFGQKI